MIDEQLKHVKIDELIKYIKANRCILFLGPQAPTFNFGDDTDIWESHTDLYCSNLKKELISDKVVFDPDAGNNPYYLATKYIHRIDENNRFDVELRKEAEDKENEIFKKVYDRESDIYNELAVIPFNTIINFSFDDFMCRALKKGGYQFAYDFYNYNGTEPKILQVDDDMPLVYNLFGDATEDGKSRIKFERDQILFLRKINSTPSLPTRLKDRIKDESKSCIFLGFNFNEWPFRFLLDTLGVPRSELSLTLISDSASVAVMTYDFYNECFGIRFLKQSPNRFIYDLIKAYKASIVEHKYGYLSYDDANESTASTFSSYLKPHNLNRKRGIKFWDRSMVQSGVIKEQIKINLDKSTIYIPFLSNDFITNPDYEEEVNYIMSKKDVLIFPVIVRNCDWTNVFPTLDKRATIILPSKHTSLLNATNNYSATEEDYRRMLTIINTKIR